MKRGLGVLALVALMGTSMFASGADIYSKRCKSCHGLNGEKAALNKSKIISQMSKQEIIDAMNGYKDGTYGGAMKGLMAGQAKTLSKEEIIEIANLIGK